MATRKSFSSFWTQIGTRLLPFADAASDELPLPRLLRLSLFQVSVGMTMVLLTGTLNRVMIVELGLAASVVSMMVALPLLFAPFRAFLGHKSDTHRSALGWKRGPYIWFGSLLLFGGFAIMPFALLLLSGDTTGPFWIGQIGAALAFLLVGAGMHTVQTAGLALAADLAPAEDHPRVVALLFVMLLIGMVFSALIFGILLRPFSQLTLIQMIQGTAVTVMVLNLIALWKQEPRTPKDKQDLKERPSFADAWRKLVARPGTRRLLAATGVGAAAFSMQDVLLEPYGGEILGMSVSGTTLLTAVLAAFTLIGFAFSAWRLTHHAEPNRLAAMGLLVGIIGFSGVIFSGPLSSTVLFVCGVALIGMGSGVFSVCVLTSVMTVIEG
ncbi:MAG: MFS transporter, partial [Pseudomonadota bacterium]